MEQLKSFRILLNKTQREFSKILDVSLSYYEKIEKGEREISNTFLKKLKSNFPQLDLNIFFEKQLHK